MGILRFCCPSIFTVDARGDDLEPKPILEMQQNQKYYFKEIVIVIANRRLGTFGN